MEHYYSEIHCTLSDSHRWTHISTYPFANTCGFLLSFSISFRNFNYNVALHKYLDSDLRVGSKINKETEKIVVAASKIWRKRKLDLIFGVSQLEDLPGYRPPLGVYSFFFFWWVTSPPLSHMVFSKSIQTFKQPKNKHKQGSQREN